MVHVVLWLPFWSTAAEWPPTLAMRASSRRIPLLERSGGQVTALSACALLAAPQRPAAPQQVQEIGRAGSCSQLLWRV